MANFNEKINCGTGHVLSVRDYFIYRSDSTRTFEQLIDSHLYFRKNAYRLCIQYKDTHPVENVAGRCFMWNCASATSNSVEVRIGCTNSHYVSKDIYEKSQVARKAVEDLAIELVISICNIENRIQ